MFFRKTLPQECQWPTRNDLEDVNNVNVINYPIIMESTLISSSAENDVLSKVQSYEQAEHQEVSRKVWTSFQRK